MTTYPDQTQAVLETIPGGSAVLKWMGGTPNFGDAEIRELHLDRSGSSRLRIEVMTRVRGCDEFAAVTFSLTDMIDVRIEGFSHQNVIAGLNLRWASDRLMHPSHIGTGLGLGEIEIELAPCVGAFGLIRASISEVGLAEI